MKQIKILKEFKSFPYSFKELGGSLKKTVHNEWLLILLIGISSGLIYKSLNALGIATDYSHVFLLSIGIVFIIFIVVHSIRKLDGGISILDKLPLPDILQEIEFASDKIVFFDTALESILLKKGDKNYKLFEDNLGKALQQNNTLVVEIYYLSIEHSFLEERARQRKIDYKDYKRDCKLTNDNLKLIRELIYRNYESSKGRVMIYEYDETPPFAMYAIDNRAYVSFYPEGKKSSEAKQLYLPSDSSLGRKICQLHEKVLSDFTKNVKTV